MKIFIIEISEGRIQWARILFKHLEDPMMFFNDHPDLLHYSEGKEAVKNYNRIGKTLVQYELTFYDLWRKQSVRSLFKSIFKECKLFTHN